MTHHALYPIVFLSAGFFGLVGLYADTLNPFGRMDRFKRPFKTRLELGSVVLERIGVLQKRSALFWKIFAFYKCAWHIVLNVRAGVRAKGGSVEDVIYNVHRLRFDPRKPYLISGDHFNVLYPRNVGVFYHSVLDAHTALSEIDWLHRQQLYLQTVAFALDVFSQYGDCATTIVPVGQRAVSCVDIYRYPSDALYGVLYGLSALNGTPGAYEPYFPASARHTLKTSTAANLLLQEYHESITTLIARYVARVYDRTTGLVRRDIALSSAKDSALRESALYDNVILWKTLHLAQELGFLLPEKIDLDVLKQHILETFWDEGSGHFLDDLSDASREHAHYSADWLVVVFTGFLDARIPAERRYLSSAVEYTITAKLDEPFPLRYQESNRPRSEVFFVRYFVPSYGGSAIWSFWGAEFIKLLIILSRFEGGDKYLARAQRHIETYEKLIVRYKGYPEVYDRKGNMLRSPLYQSVRQTGWVVGFEQARALIRKSSC